MIYKDNLKKLRIDNGLTQDNVGKIIGVDRKAYSHFETEYTIIPIEHINVLANYYNVCLDYLFGFCNKKNYSYIKKEIDVVLSGARLKEVRKENKLTQDRLSNFLKSDRSTISYYESGKNKISTSCLYEVCKKYRISADYLLGKVDEPKYLDKKNVSN